jgi:pimeloyl-ACP methyl ester carboxylesterase
MRQLLLNIILILFVFNIIFYSCTKEDENYFTREDWTVLADTSHLSNVSVSAIFLMTQLAGYPQFNKYLKNSIEIYKISYHTVYKGEPVIASGVIVLPANEQGPSPVMVVGNGLIFAESEAPSEFSLPGHYTGFEFIGALGYITFLPDMIGFGDSKEKLFPIHNYEHSASATIDFIYAGREFLKTMRIESQDEYYLAGYSQGGYIGMSTLKYVQENHLDIQFKKTALGAGGYNLKKIVEYHIENGSYPSPSHMALLLSSYNVLYDWNRQPGDFFNEPYASWIPELINGQYTREQVDSYLPSSFDSLLCIDFYNGLKENTDTTVFDALELNSIHNWAPQTKIRLYHGINDEKIPFSDSEETYETMVNNGATQIEFVSLSGDTHYNSALDFIELVIQWFKSST